MKRFISIVAVFAALTMWVSAGFAAEQEVTGAGATFPYPLYSKMFDAYSKERAVRVNYQAIGSGGGIRQLVNKTVDFGGSDAVMTDEDARTAGAPVLHIPTCAGAVVLTYELPGNPEIRFTPAHLRAAGQSRDQVHPGRHRGHLPGQDQEVERPAPYRPKPRRFFARPRRYRDPPFRRQRDHQHLQRLPEQGEQGLERKGRCRHGSQLAGRPRCKR
jgi:hypothetical protein